MRTWLIILTIKLGIVKLICDPIPTGALLKFRMNNLGLYNKDIARGIGANTAAVYQNLRKGNGVLMDKIEKFINKAEKMR